MIIIKSPREIELMRKAGEVVGKVFVGDENINLTSLNVVLQLVSDSCLKEIEFLGHLDGQVQISVIY